ncbi:MAG: hydrogenase maturation nickel metallochaperone HypA [Candidatus Eremiobacteraeota bacterium]|nr:hydrogenase maturation nickel metallochaperone HypA [Candidatus Eremiobacteraeota bacterium]
MHELSVAMAIIDEVSERCAGEKASRIAAVHLRIGELSSVVNDALIFSWDLAAEGTVAAGSLLKIERVAVAVECPNCARERRPMSANHLVCIECGTPAPQIVRGRELEVVAMEVIDADTSGGSSALDT